MLEFIYYYFLISSILLINSGLYELYVIFSWCNTKNNKQFNISMNCGHEYALYENNYLDITLLSIYLKTRIEFLKFYISKNIINSSLQINPFFKIE